MAKSNPRNSKEYVRREIDNDLARGMKKVIVADSFVPVCDSNRYTNIVSTKCNDERYASSSKLSQLDGAFSSQQWHQPEISANRSNLAIPRFDSKDNSNSNRSHRSSTLSSSSPERSSVQNTDIKGRVIL